MTSVVDDGLSALQLLEIRWGRWGRAAPNGMESRMQTAVRYYKQKSTPICSEGGIALTAAESLASSPVGGKRGPDI